MEPYFKTLCHIPSTVAMYQQTHLLVKATSAFMLLEGLMNQVSA